MPVTKSFKLLNSKFGLAYPLYVEIVQVNLKFFERLILFEHLWMAHWHSTSRITISLAKLQFETLFQNRTGHFDLSYTVDDIHSFICVSSYAMKGISHSKLNGNFSTNMMFNNFI